ncbi:MAG: phosphocholine cytidylyltransferase family protein [Planctomycetota bacterium]|jgi:choline kinase
MKAVILAAGMGKRLAATGWDRPKCLLDFGGRTLLDHMLSSIRTCDIRRVVVVVGYRRELVRQAVAAHDIEAEFVVNDDYAETNTINSLYLAREHLNEDFVYFNADVLLDWRILPMLLDGDGGRLAIDVKHCGAEEVKVVVDGDGRITQIGKALPVEQCLGEFIGVGKFAESCCEDFAAELVRYNEQLGERNLFFESAVNDIVSRHVHHAVSIGELGAVEIDSPEDLELARRLWDNGAIEAPPA